MPSFQLQHFTATLSGRIRIITSKLDVREGAAQGYSVLQVKRSGIQTLRFQPEYGFRKKINNSRGFFGPL